MCKLDNGFVVFVPRALPGEQLTARITSASTGKGFARGTKLKVIRPHDNPDEPECPHFGPCGGCALQSMEYGSQTAFKAHQVASLMQRVGKIPNLDAVMQPIVECDQTYEYRNKMEFSLEPGSITFGLHVPGNQYKIMPVTTCSLQQPLANDILHEIENLCIKYGIDELQGKPGSNLSSRSSRFNNRRNDDTSRDSRGGRGGWRGGGGSREDGSYRERGPRDSERDRYSDSRRDTPRERSGPLQLIYNVVIRHSMATDQYLVNFVTSKDAREVLTPVARDLRQRFGDRLAGCVNSVTERGRPTAERRIAKEYALEGSNYLVEKLCGIEYEISPNSFFQVNTKQAEKLFQIVLAAADLKETDTALDLYCGGGAITLLLAQKCKRVHGVDLSQSSVDDARRNALRNKITNADFTCSDAAMDLPRDLRSSEVIIVDPARQGLSAEVVRSMRLTNAQRVVYVSCNPSTQARDISLLCDDDGEGRPFCLVSVTPVDMYPHTPHCESVAVLHRN